MTPATERLVGLLAYVEQLERLCRVTAFTVPDEIFCVYRPEIEGLPGLSFSQVHEGDDIWLSAPRLGAIPPPEPPASLAPWIVLAESADSEPQLRSEIIRSAGEVRTRLTLANFPGVTKLYQTYMTQQWTPWAAGERPRRDAIALYGRLFALRQLLENDNAADPLELVWGMGIASWKPAGARTVVAFPLLTQSCELELDEDTYALVVRPRNVDADVELDAFAELDNAGVAPLAAAWTQHCESAANRPSPFDPPSTTPFLKTAIRHLDARGHFDDSPATPAVPTPGEKLVVTDGWVLFARRRSRRSLIGDLERLQRRLEKTAALPPLLDALVSPRGASTLASETRPMRGLSAPGIDARDVWFPLAFSEAQASIVAQLANRDAVVVHGPPGTGKTHTIANLICHVLGSGQRILVTAQSTATLGDLQGKLPAELRELSVAVLTNEREGMRQLVTAIESIAAAPDAVDHGSGAADIAVHEKRLGELHHAIAALDRKIDGLARKQLCPAAIDGREVEPIELAQLVVEQAAEHGWFTDPLDPDTQGTPAFTADDVGELRTARARLDTDLVYRGCSLPPLEGLPTEATLLELHRGLVRAQRIEAKVSSGTVLPLVDATPTTIERATKLRELFRREEALRSEMEKDPFSWAERLRTRFEAREDPVARGLITAARSIAVEELARRARLAQPVEAPADAELSDEVMEAVARRAEGKFGFLNPIGKKDARTRLDAITVAGVKPSSAEDWQRVAAELEHRLKARKLLAGWNAMIKECGLDPVREKGSGAFRALAARAEHVLRVHELVTRVEAPIRTEVPAVFAAKALERLPGHEDTSRMAVVESLMSHLDKGELTQASARLREVLRHLEGCSGPIVDQLWTFLTTELGKTAGESDEPIRGRWADLVAELQRVHDLRPLLATVERVADAIEAAGAPGWAQRLRTVPAGVDSDPLTPRGWRDAWHWRVAAMLLGRLEGHDTLKQLIQRRQTAASDLDRAYDALIKARVWHFVRERSPASVCDTLEYCADVIAADDDAVDVRALKHGRAVRTAIEQAQSAVPCWIVPLWRVAELLPAELGLFDVIVIDDASQAEIGALAAILRAKRLVVIGDEQQLQPPAPAIAARPLKELVVNRLAAQPYAAQLAPGRSIYDLARAAFGRHVIELNEHFTSLPSIIEYSYREFYGGELQPMRIPVASERLTPALVDALVEGGARHGDVNEAEAIAIVDEIRAIVDDPSTAGRSIGVVSLIGDGQARRIDALIRERISPRDIIERRILSGTPAAFQGRSRAIMLLSMVLAKNDRGMADGIEVGRTFNVAASRASERMVLFRSIEESDVGTDSLSARLIRHFRQPFGADARAAGQRRELCESDFEQELFDALAARGFGVRPQVSFGGFRIDLVAEGLGDRRLAIACDGDRQHAPDRWSQDMARQHTLERMGWFVWRCFASSFALRREHVLNDLFGTLERLRIEPLESPAVEEIWSERRVVRAALEGDSGGARVRGGPRIRDARPARSKRKSRRRK